jgi:hypothetical protein
MGGGGRERERERKPYFRKSGNYNTNTVCGRNTTIGQQFSYSIKSSIIGKTTDCVEIVHTYSF